MSSRERIAVLISFDPVPRMNYITTLPLVRHSDSADFSFLLFCRISCIVLHQGLLDEKHTKHATQAIRFSINVHGGDPTVIWRKVSD